MHIPQPIFTKTKQLQIISYLQKLINQPSAQQVPPCINCKKLQSTKINCTYNCYNVAEALSEEPERYPIEPNVVPLVFELTTLRLVQTCWSCEGHTNAYGTIMKLPQVSFYVENPYYAQLISNYLSDLFRTKKLHYPWEIILSDYGQTLEITYTIKCNLSLVTQPNIKTMHNDLNTMAKDLSISIKKYANNLLIKFSN